MTNAVDAFEIISFSHIGMAVESVDEFRETWGRALGITDWLVYEVEGNGGIQLHGTDVGRLHVRAGFARIGGTSLELIETKVGETHHSQHVKTRGAGLHHIAFWVPDLPRELAKCHGLDLEIVHSPSSLHPALRDRPVSAVGAAPADSEFPGYFAFLDTFVGRTHFALELLDARFAEDYRALNGPYPYYPGDLPG